MWPYPDLFDVIVVGAGHAGVEAAHGAAKMGAKTLLLTLSLDTIAKMSCNPSIGGTAKGHIVREIDALGGIMGKIADRTAIHLRMLNSSKGASTRSPRAQSDKLLYQIEVKKFLESVDNLEIKQAKVEKVIVEKGKIKGVQTREGVIFLGSALIITTGTFLNGLIYIGHNSFTSGRNGEEASSLSNSLKEIGLKLARLKTGTPPRIHKRSIDFSKTEKQPSEEGVRFSFDENDSGLDKVDCYITYTTKETKEIIEKNLKKSALFSGLIKGKGPRYCPSIEDKIIRFNERERHQIFLEPEGLKTDEIYVNGISSSMPFEVQLEVTRSLVGLNNAEIMRPAYAIEYDFVTSSQVYNTLETKCVENLFLAGQINGTTGYEEAAAQGLIAGINAVCKLRKKAPFILRRSEGYIGVLIDDISFKELDEPYRMFTSRAEYRLLLRQDNADLRLRHYGYELGLINRDQYEKVLQKKKIITEEIERLFKTFAEKKVSLAQMIARPEIDYLYLLQKFPDKVKDFSYEINSQIETEIKYAGYIARQQKEIEKLENLEKVRIPNNFPFCSIKSLSNEAREKLTLFAPPTLAVASRLTGVSPADISILMIELMRR